MKGERRKMREVNAGVRPADYNSFTPDLNASQSAADINGLVFNFFLALMYCNTSLERFSESG